MATPGNKLTGNAAYKVHIPLYEGPLDLLLDLIKKQEMSIHDIQISKITSEYLEYLHKLEELTVDVSAEFIYMAATLIYIKSKMLLPRPEEAAQEAAAEAGEDTVAAAEEAAAEAPAEDTPATVEAAEEIADEGADGAQDEASEAGEEA